MMEDNQSLGKKNINLMWEDFRLSGSNRSLAQIYFEHFDSLFDFGLKFTNDRALIEDSIQNIFSYFLKKRKRLNPVNNLTFYLLQSFRRELIRQITKKNRLSLTDALADQKDLFCISDAEEEMNIEEQNEVVSLVKTSIKKLGARQQEIVYLRFNQDLSYVEIAEMLNISVDSCYKSVYRAIKHIKDDIGKKYPDSAGLLFVIIRTLKKY